MSMLCCAVLRWLAGFYNFPGAGASAVHCQRALRHLRFVAAASEAAPAHPLQVVGAAATAVTGKATTTLAYQGISLNSNNGYMCAAACVGGPYTQVMSPSMSISVTGQCVPSASISATAPTLSCEPAFKVAAVGVDNVATASTLLTVRAGSGGRWPDNVSR